MNDHYEHEDASNLEFGKALTGKSPVLFNAEVAVLLDNRRKEYQEKGLRVPEALTLTLDYCKRFGGVKPADEEGANQYLTNLRQVLEQWDFGDAEVTPYKKSLHPFEVAALANLMTTSSDRDEACTLWICIALFGASPCCLLDSPPTLPTPITYRRAHSELAAHGPAGGPLHGRPVGRGP